MFYQIILLNWCETKTFNGLLRIYKMLTSTYKKHLIYNPDLRFNCFCYIFLVKRHLASDETIDHMELQLTSCWHITILSLCGG